MSKRVKGVKVPVVDAADVQKVADLFLSISNPTGSDEDLAQHAATAALAYGYAFGVTSAWRDELVRKVKQRVQYALTARRRGQPPN